MASKAEIRKRATKGAILLDSENPNWCKKINLEDLNLANVEYCVLGQLYGYYSDGQDILFGYDKAKTATRYGFYTEARYGTYSDRVYGVLQEQWVEEIGKRCDNVSAKDN